MFIIDGNISKTAETRLVNGRNGKTMVTDFWVAKNTGYGATAATMFFKVTLWGERYAKLAQYLVSGKEVYIEAKFIRANPYLRDDGTPAATMELSRVVEITLKGKKILAEDGDEAPATEENDEPFPG